MIQLLQWVNWSWFAAVLVMVSRSTGTCFTVLLMVSHSTCVCWQFSQYVCVLVMVSHSTCVLAIFTVRTCVYWLCAGSFAIRVCTGHGHPQHVCELVVLQYMGALVMVSHEHVLTWLTAA